MCAEQMAHPRVKMDTISSAGCRFSLCAKCMNGWTLDLEQHHNLLVNKLIKYAWIEAINKFGKSNSSWLSRRTFDWFKWHLLNLPGCFARWQSGSAVPSCHFIAALHEGI